MPSPVNRRRRMLRERAVVSRYPNPNYYGLPKSRRGRTGGYAPPEPVARALFKDGQAYGKALTPRQKAYFSVVGKIKQTYKSKGKVRAKRGK